MLIPGSHKSNFGHPYHGNFSMGQNRSVDDIEGGGRYMKAGDALLVCGWYFTRLGQTDQSGKPSSCDLSIGPPWGNFRHGYQPSPELLSRLAPERRQIGWPQKLLKREPQINV